MGLSRLWRADPAVEMRFCAEHRAKFPEPYYRTLLVPVGATLTLPSDAP